MNLRDEGIEIRILPTRDDKSEGKEVLQTKKRGNIVEKISKSRGKKNQFKENCGEKRIWKSKKGKKSNETSRKKKGRKKERKKER